MFSAEQPELYLNIVAENNTQVGIDETSHSLSIKQPIVSKFLEEIDTLGPLKRDIDGIISFPYFKGVFAIIWKYASAHFIIEKKQLIEKRRSLLKQDKKLEYIQLAKVILFREKASFQDFMGFATSHLGLTILEFAKVHEIYMSNPETFEILLKIEIMAPPIEVPTITKEKGKELFMKFEEKKMATFETMMNNNDDKMNKSPKERQLAYMIILSKFSDEMKEEHGVDEEELESAIAFYNLMDDKEIQEMVMRMQKHSH